MSRIVGNEVDHLGTLVLERQYTRERRVQKVLFIIGEFTVGIAFFGTILALCFALAASV